MPLSLQLGRYIQQLAAILLKLFADPLGNVLAI
jgi:hypothetical protein